MTEEYTFSMTRDDDKNTSNHSTTFTTDGWETHIELTRRFIEFLRGLGYVISYDDYRYKDERL